MPYNVEFLTPVLALIVWTLIMWVWMYATRLPAMQKAGIDPDDVRHSGHAHKDKFPPNVRAIADNYNHLHEQPTVFYALMFYIALTGGSDHIMTYLAWAYVGARILHTFVQSFSPKVAHRFLVFTIATLVLMVMAGRAVWQMYA